MKRRALVAAMGALLVAPNAGAQPARRRKIGILLYSANDAFEQSFIKTLRDAGYVDGQNIEIVRRDGKADEALLQQYAQELVRERVDVIVVWSTDAVATAMRATSTIPIIGAVADPLRSGLVKNLARPEANFAEVAGPQDLERGITQAMHEGAQGLALQQFFFSQSRAIAELTLCLKLPAIGWQRPFVEAGGLIAFGTMPDDNYRLLARYVDKVLAGVPVANLPIEQAVRSELIVNQRTARMFGLSLPPLLLARADEVIE